MEPDPFEIAVFAGTEGKGIDPIDPLELLRAIVEADAGPAVAAGRGEASGDGSAVTSAGAMDPGATEPAVVMIEEEVPALLMGADSEVEVPADGAAAVAMGRRGIAQRPTASAAAAPIPRAAMTPIVRPRPEPAPVVLAPVNVRPVTPLEESCGARGAPPSCTEGGGVIASGLGYQG